MFLCILELQVHAKTKVKEQPAQVLTPVELAIRMYNSMGTTNRLIAMFKIGASDNDINYLNKVTREVSAENLHRASINTKDNSVSFQGVDAHFRIVDISKQILLIEGSTVTINPNDDLEDSIYKIKKALSGDSIGLRLIDWLIPRAQASLDSTSLALSMATLGALSCSTQNPNNPTSCSMNFLLPALLMASAFEQPAQVSCPTTTTACVIYPSGARNCFPQNLSPAQNSSLFLPSISSPLASASASQLAAVCGNTPYLNSINTYLAQGSMSPFYRPMSTFPGSYPYPNTAAPMAFANSRPTPAKPAAAADAAMSRTPASDEAPAAPSAR